MYSELRMVHILFGIFVGGYYLFMEPILMPRLKRLGLQNKVMPAIMPVLGPVMVISFLVIFGTGTAMTLIMRQGNLSSMVTTGWGLVILAGAVATAVDMVIGFGMIMPKSLRLSRISNRIVGREPTLEEAKQMGRLSKRVDALTRTNFVLGVFAIATMLAARFV